MRLTMSSFVTFLVLTMAGCQEGSPKSTQEQLGENRDTSAVGDLEGKLRAGFRTNLDRFAYPRIIVLRQDGESEASFAVREIDAQLEAFRERGLAYWREQPDDPIVYEWLAATIALPPSYALDKRNWAEAEFDLIPNTSPRDDAAIAAWEVDYAVLRDQFFSSDEVSAQLKRFLWSSEIRNRLYRDREKFAKTGARPKARPYIQEFLEFIQTFSYPDEVSSVVGSRKEAHLWSMISILRPAFGRHDILEVSNGQLSDFVEQLEKSGSNAAEIVASHMRQHALNFNYHFLHAKHRNFEIAIADAFSSFENLYSGPSDIAPTTNAVFYSTPLYPALNQPQNEIEATALFKDGYLGSLAVLEKGRRYWNQLSTEDKYEWLRVTGNQGGPTFFPIDSLAYVIGLNTSDQNSDLAELDYWIATMRSLSNDLVGTGSLTDSQIQVIEVLQGRRIFFSAFLNNAPTVGQRADEYRRELFDLIEAIVERADEVPEHSYGVASFLSSVYRHSSRAGIPETLVKAVYAELPDTSSEEINSLIASVLNPTRLARGVEVSMQAETLSGDSFDTEDLRGSIVLVDHWDTNCGPCIAAMPVLHEVYERYKEQGVEVVSIAYDGSSQRSQVDRIKEENGLTWITLDGEGLWPAVAAQYGYRGVPQYMLLDRDGRWYAGTEEMGNGANFEALLSEMLAAEKAEIVH